MSDVASKTDSRNSTMSSGNVYGFVAQWLDALKQRHPSQFKDWEALEMGQNQANNVLSFKAGRDRLQGGGRQPNESAYYDVNHLVGECCINRQLSVCGFNAFLREMTGLRNLYNKSLEKDIVLDRAMHSLVKGYWEQVKPGGYGNANDLSMEDQQAMAQMQQTIDEYESTVVNDLDPQLPFKSDLAQALGSAPSVTPTLMG